MCILFPFCWLCVSLFRIMNKPSEIFCQHQNLTMKLNRKEEVLASVDCRAYFVLSTHTHYIKYQKENVKN